MMPMVDEVCNNNNSVKLQSRDGEIFEVEMVVASTSGFIKMMMEDLGTKITIPLPVVSSKILRMVIQYCKYHVADAPIASPDVVKTWDEEFVKALIDDRATLFELADAADYLVIKNLLDFTCQTIADMVKEKTVEEVRALFYILNVN